jgi:hypothetical protein
MKGQALKTSFLFVIFLFSFSCSGQRVLIFYTEEYWWEFLAGRDGFEESLQEMLQTKGWRMERVWNEDSRVPGIEPGNADLIVLNPFMQKLALQLAEGNPDLPFLFIGNLNLEAVQPKNLLIASFDRYESYRDAGEMMGRLIADLNISAEEVKKLGILSSRESQAADREIDAFLEGFLESSEQYFLIERELEDSEDRIKVRAILEEMKKQGAFLYLLKLYNLLPVCLDFIDKEGGMAIVEDWSRSTAFADNIALSLEEDYVATFSAALENLSEDGWRSKRIQGVTRVMLSAKAAELMKLAAPGWSEDMEE